MLALACGGEDLTLPSSSARVPASLSIVSGDDQSAGIGEALPAPLVVQLADADGLPVAGATVSFQFSNAFPDAVIDPVAPATDSLGLATASARLGTIPGIQPIQAQVATPGQDLLVTFQVRALAKTPPGAGDQGGGGAAEPPGDAGGSPGPPGGDSGNGNGGSGNGGNGNGSGGNGNGGNGGGGNGGGGNSGGGNGGGGGGSDSGGGGRGSGGGSDGGGGGHGGGHHHHGNGNGNGDGGGNGHGGGDDD